MKRILVLLLALAGSVALAGQSTSIDPAAVPVEQEPRHRLVFVNEFVRIIDAVLPPLYVSQNHTHTLDNVAVTILSGIAGAQGQARIGFAGYSRGGYSHVITNPNTTPMRFVAVELRAPDHGAGEDVPQENHRTVLSNAHVRISRVKLDAGRSIDEHQHPSGYISIVVRGVDAPGTWRWHAAGEAAARLDAGKQPLDIVEVEPR
ncbi:MAG: Cupin domain protein [Labilithrix sp.]|nr:Cupin domain protein [Labilithrix sp.]